MMQINPTVIDVDTHGDNTRGDNFPRVLSPLQIGRMVEFYDDGTDLPADIRTLLRLFFNKLQRSPWGFYSDEIFIENSPIDQNPQIAAWLLACTHVAGLTRYSIIRSGNFSKHSLPSYGGHRRLRDEDHSFGWKIWDRNRPDEMNIADSIICALNGYWPIINGDYAIVGTRSFAGKVAFTLDFLPTMICSYADVLDELRKHPMTKWSTPGEIRLINSIEFGLTGNRIMKIIIPTTAGRRMVDSVV